MAQPAAGGPRPRSCLLSKGAGERFWSRKNAGNRAPSGPQNAKLTTCIVPGLMQLNTTWVMHFAVVAGNTHISVQELAGQLQGQASCSPGCWEKARHRNDTPRATASITDSRWGVAIMRISLSL